MDRKKQIIKLLLQCNANDRILKNKVENLTFCTFCGKVLNRDYFYCPYCGTQCRDYGFEEIAAGGFEGLFQMETKDGISRLDYMKTVLENLESELDHFLSFKMI